MGAVSTIDLPLLPLGRGRDLETERGVECPGDLPAASDPDLVARARVAKEALGDRVFVLGHHYQRDEVIEFADVTGDSFKLARDAAARPEAEYIVFCGVHFMAESADILTGEHQPVVLPDLAAGCSMADMARLPQVEDAWDALVAAGVADGRRPGDLHELQRRHQGVRRPPRRRRLHVEQRRHRPRVGLRAGRRTRRSCSSPTSTSAATPPCSRSGSRSTTASSGTRCSPTAGSTPEQLRDARMILWRGHCSVHGRFSPVVVDELRAKHPGIQILVHPECTHEVVLKADLVGSTEFIIKTVEAAPAGSTWAIGTELNLVKRLAAAHPDKHIAFLDKTVCYCSTMNRIDLPHFVWALESLVAGRWST